ncbi:MAG: hypothetical protein EA397_05475 [Deltaproteobacteria bacterium]|nr:MAG: hypothetical protein EA397_05475 [Deltaproteobacteria bacterium]
MTRLLVALFLVGCVRLPPGEPCEATGEGFHRKDPCSYTCVEWEVFCDDGSTIIPGVCSGGACSSDADCGPGLSCARTGSVANSCLPDHLCGDDGFEAPTAASFGDLDPRTVEPE